MLLRNFVKKFLTEIIIVNALESLDNDYSIDINNNVYGESENYFLIKDISLIMSPLNQILEIFPDAKSSWINDSLAKFNNEVQDVLNIMLGNGYEKVPIPEVIKNVSCEKIDFLSTKRITSENYRFNAMFELQNNNFPFLELSGIHYIFLKNNCHYFPTLKEIETLIGYNAMNFHNKKPAPMTTADKKQVQENIKKSNLLHNNRLFVKTSSFFENALIQKTVDNIFERELLYTKKIKAEELDAISKITIENLENGKVAEEKLKHEESLIECGCCCCDFPFETVVQCTEGHLFCKECLQRYVEQTVFGNGLSNLSCMNTGNEKCNGYFSDVMIKNAVTEKAFEKFEEALARDAIKEANIENLLTCFNCQFKVEMHETAGITYSYTLL
jgi:hypothetical protein